LLSVITSGRGIRGGLTVPPESGARTLPSGVSSSPLLPPVTDY
jgi:hypothetical protein